MREHDGDDEVERRALYKFSPVIALANAIVTLGLSGGVVVWAIGQERTDARHEAQITANSARIDRAQSDIRDNRNDIQQALIRIEAEMKTMNSTLARLQGQTGK